MKIVGLFIKWIFVNIVAKICKMNESLHDGIRYNTGETFFFWFLSTIAATLINLIFVISIASLTNTKPSGWFVLWAPLTMFAHLVYTSFSVMFQNFKEERAELFEIIKNSK